MGKVWETTFAIDKKEGEPAWRWKEDDLAFLMVWSKCCVKEAWYVVVGSMMYVCIEWYRSVFCRGGTCRFLGRLLCPRRLQSGDIYQFQFGTQDL